MGGYSSTFHGLNVPQRPVKILGKNPDIDDVREDLIEFGGTYVFPSLAGIQMRIQSSSANDTAAGTGVQQVEIIWLDNLWEEHSETIILNGVTPVTTTFSNAIRINGMQSAAVGTGGMAAGNITLTNAGGSVIYSQISTGINRALQAIFTVPLNKQYYVYGWSAGVGNAAANRWAEILLRATANDSVGVIQYRNGIFHIWDIISGQDATFNKNYSFPIIYPEKTDIKVSAISDNSAANSVCSASIDGVLVDKNQ